VRASETGSLPRADHSRVGRTGRANATCADPRWRDPSSQVCAPWETSKTASTTGANAHLACPKHEWSGRERRTRSSDSNLSGGRLLLERAGEATTRQIEHCCVALSLHDLPKQLARSLQPSASGQMFLRASETGSLPRAGPLARRTYGACQRHPCRPALARPVQPSVRAVGNSKPASTTGAFAHLACPKREWSRSR
jgi:hypothetical protein